MRTISAAIIVKNESRCIIRCLSSIVDAVDEIIIVDTGSEDNTIELVEGFSAVNPKVRVFNFQWCNDFSAARNFSLEKVSSEWVFVVDADEFLYEEDVKKVKRLVKHYSKSNELYGLDVELLDVRMGKITGKSPGGIMRIFPRMEGLLYSGIIHESVKYPLKRAEVKIRLLHDGYDDNEINQIEKVKRNVTLLNEVLQQDPYNPMHLMYFAYEISKFNFEKGLEYFTKARKATNNEEILKWIDVYESEAIKKFGPEFTWRINS